MKDKKPNPFAKQPKDKAPKDAKCGHDKKQGKFPAFLKKK
jgi:hypothetical protein